MNSKLPHQIAYVDEAGIDNREDYPYGYCQVGQRFYALKSGKRTPASQLDCRIEGGEIICADDLCRLLQPRLV